MERLNEVLRVLDGIAERFSEMKSTATNNCLYANNNEHMGSELIRLAVWHEAIEIIERAKIRTIQNFVRWKQEQEGDSN